MSKNEEMLHNLWGKAKEGVYDKKLWAEFHFRIVELEKALNKLIDLKDLKDREGKVGYYNTAMPAAWEKAKEVLKR